MRHNTSGFSTVLAIGMVAALILAGAFYFLYMPRSTPFPPSSEGNSPINDLLVSDEGGDILLREGACSGDKAIACPPPEIAVCKEGTWICVGPASGGGGERIPGAPVSFTGTVLAGSSAPLIDFNVDDYSLALDSDKLVVLYFYANGCALCKQEAANALYPAFNEFMTDRVVGFQVNYRDSETDAIEEDLAREFGVNSQQTKVFLKNGERILKAPDSWDKTRYLTEINKAL